MTTPTIKKGKLKTVMYIQDSNLALPALTWRVTKKTVSACPTNLWTGTVFL